VSEPDDRPRCPACAEFFTKYPWTGKKHKGAEVFGFGSWASSVRCAFDKDGVFRADNWMCASLTPLLHRAWKVEATDRDQHAAVLSHLERLILLSYYKRRGGTEGAWVVEEDQVRPLTLADLYPEMRVDPSNPAFGHETTGDGR